MKTKNVGATVSVSWGDDVEVSVRLTPTNWAKIKVGKPVNVRGNGYHYEGEFFRDYWHFGGGLDGSLTVGYGKDGGVGFEGDLNDAEIEEHREAATALNSPEKQTTEEEAELPGILRKRRRHVKA